MMAKDIIYDEAVKASIRSTIGPSKRSKILSAIFEIFVWLCVNSVLGTMNFLLISFYSQESIYKIFISAQITTHAACLFIELSMRSVGTKLHEFFRDRGSIRLSYVSVVIVSTVFGLIGLNVGAELHEKILGFDAYGHGGFFNAILGTLAIGIYISAFDRWLRNSREKQQLMETELQAARYLILQDRMRPHFLFNALNTIHSMLAFDASQADVALRTLSGIYRYLLGPSTQALVSFAEEWTFTKDYIEFQRLRYSDRLVLKISESGKLDGIKIPPLSIQPLVENAFKHGLEKMTDGDLILEIEAHEIPGGCVVRISDNGPGLTANQGKSVSLQNILHRIQYHYEKSKLTLERQNHRTVLELNIQ